ncbi:Uncharacterised protein [Flavonifractor plautii]|uniref:Uncharacterized protein n=1 Tax=Flavonifractor plautii TaxID=292800 RepID=A0A174VMP2_FLAPL|nr:Uncharacterised protein [Flavonifractor plautii]
MRPSRGAAKPIRGERSAWGVVKAAPCTTQLRPGSSTPSTATVEKICTLSGHAVPAYTERGP